MDYLYDGTFEGLLCCIYAHYYSEKAEGIFEQELYQQNLLHNFALVETDGEKAARVYNAIRGKISGEALRRVYAVYLSAAEEREMKILRYIEMGFRMGGQINLLHANQIVFDVQQAEKKVYGEVHRFYGILRFSVLAAGPPSYEASPLTINEPLTVNQEEALLSASESQSAQRTREVLYAYLEPDHDIIELMAGHFADRYKNDPFILHDVSRGKAIFAQGGHWYMEALPKDVEKRLAPGEEEYRALWKQYFETIAIKERINPTCQKRCMPARYWKNLTEIQ